MSEGVRRRYVAGEQTDSPSEGGSRRTPAPLGPATPRSPRGNGLDDILTAHPLEAEDDPKKAQKAGTPWWYARACPQAWSTWLPSSTNMRCLPASSIGGAACASGHDFGLVFELHEHRLDLHPRVAGSCPMCFHPLYRYLVSYCGAPLVPPSF